jgi:hypothetical protein
MLCVALLLPPLLAQAVVVRMVVMRIGRVRISVAALLRLALDLVPVLGRLLTLALLVAVLPLAAWAAV